MSGIAGMIGLEPRPFDEAVLEGMVARLAHRGPRVKRLRRPAVWFAALDAETPMIWPPDGRELPRELSVVVDGAIDNAIDLMQELTRAGHPAPRDPAGLLAVGFRASGPAFLSRVRGVFAAAIHDHDTETTWLVRDPLGTRPLYLHRTRSRIVFASEIRALLADPAVRLDLDPAQLRVLLSLGFNPAPNTLLKGIHKMPPGHLLEVGRLGVRVVSYDLPGREAEKELDLTFDEAVESYRSTLHRVVRRIGDSSRKDSAVAKGSAVLLSGGGDSSALVWMQTSDKIPVTTFTAGFPDGGDDIDERVHAWQAARALGTMHRERLIDLAEIGSLFNAAARVIEEPVASGWITPMLRLLESASGQAPAVWSGQGTGALHGEDPMFRWMQWGESVADLPSIVGRMVGQVARLAPVRPSAETGARLLSTPEERDRVLGSFFLFDDASLDHLLRAGHIGDSEAVRKLLDRWRDPVVGRDPLAQALYISARTYLPEAIFTPAGRLAAESRLEIRFPYADCEIVRFLERLPAAYRLEGGTGKRLHREALGAWIPGAVLSRPKCSMTDAVARWLRGEGKEKAEGWLLGPNAWMPSVLDGVRVRRVIEDAVRGRARIETLVLLIQLELWARETLLGGMR